MKHFILIQTGLFIITLFFQISGQTAESARTQAINSYQKGEYPNAISLFKSILKNNEKDGEVLYFLGVSQIETNDPNSAQRSLQKAAKLLPQDARPISALALAAVKRGKIKEARKFAGKAIALNPNNAEAYYLLGAVEKSGEKYAAAITAADKAIALAPNLAFAYLLKAEASIYNSIKIAASPPPIERKSHFLNAISILQSYPNLTFNSLEATKVRDMIDGYEAFADYYDQSEKRKNTPPSPNDENLAKGNPNEKRLEILYKPRAQYTQDARKNQISGTVRVLVLFSRTGKTMVFPITDLPNGLTENAVQAARQINFLPMQKDGQPVSVVRVVEYNFNLY